MLLYELLMLTQEMATSIVLLRQHAHGVQTGVKTNSIAALALDCRAWATLKHLMPLCSFASSRSALGCADLCRD